MEAVFTINGKLIRASSHTLPIDISLGSYLRYHVQLKGTKFMCREGGCGACLVNVTGMHPVTKERGTWAVNSCLFPLFSCHGLDILTVEGIGNKREGYHPTQTRLAHFNGTQCGFCSPGMVMNMYSLMESNGGKVTMEEVENSFGGNICRCTGYRPILDAFKSLAIDADPKLLEACQDIEELPKICPNSGKACGGKCSVLQNPDLRNDIHLKFEDNKEWYKVTTVSEIFRILDSIGSRPYMLVAGNTATGVYRRSNDLEVFIDVNSVEELRSHSLSGNLTLGGNVTLSDLMKILADTSAVTGFEYCKEIVKHLHLVANIPVRNTGTVAGNLSIKHQHEEFSSDIFLILEAVGARLTIAESANRSTFVSLADYKLLDMKGKIILSVTLFPYDPNFYSFRSYKVMPRAQNAFSYVAAAFLFNLDNGIVRTAAVCYTGISPALTHVKELESFLVGKELFKNEVLQETLTIMSNFIRPDFVPPDASPEFRKTLTTTLLYRAVLSMAMERKIPVNPLYLSGVDKFERALSTGSQIFDTIQENWPLTKNIPKIEALAQTAGEADYVDDLPNFAQQLFAAFVLATKPHATILSIDASRALEQPDVVAFYSAKDIPGVNNYMPPKMNHPEVEEIFCGSKVRYHGQPVGVILADSFEAAIRSARLVDIEYSDTDGKPVLPTIKEAFKAGAFERIVHTKEGKVGPNYGKASSSIRVEGDFELPQQYHFTMETQQCVCVPIDDGMDVYCSTQWVNLCQTAISHALQVPESSLNFRVRRVGGAFGSKITRCSLIACACAVAAHMSQRPVRLITTLGTNMEVIGKRQGCVSKYEAEVNESGKIIRLLNNYYHDSGHSHNEPVEMITSFFYQNCYDVDQWKIVPHSVLTDAPGHTWCRAPGSNEGIAMSENIMEHIAHVVGKDPQAVRLENIPEDSKMRQLLPTFMKEVDYKVRQLEIELYNVQNRWRKRGLAIVPMKYPQTFGSSLQALVSIHHVDGTVAITTGGIEMGQGLNTKVAQVAAKTLGVPLDKLRIKAMTNLTSPNAIVSGGSMASDAACYAVRKTCEILVERLIPIREQLPNATWEQITFRAFTQDVDLSAQYNFKSSDIGSYTVWGLACAEVEVDVLTGSVQILRVDLLEDVGESISPGIDVGQIEGAFVMGIGLYLTENLVYSKETGQLLTNRTWNYKPPGARDIPIDFRVKFLQNTYNENFVLRSKATGEPALNMTVVLLFALRNALNSARKDAGLPTDWYNLATPATPEQICLLAGNDSAQFKIL